MDESTTPAPIALTDRLAVAIGFLNYILAAALIGLLTGIVVSVWPPS